MPDAWLLTTAGFHVPEIPLTDVVGKVGTVPSAQIVSEVPKSKVGNTLGVTVTLKVTADAHPPPGVKV